MKNASVLTEKSSAPTDAPTIGQIQEINTAGLSGLTTFLSRLRFADAQRFVGDPNLITEAVSRAVIELLPRRVVIPHQEVERWNRYYRDTFGIEHSFEGLDVPAETGYATRLIVMHADISARPQRIATAYKARCQDAWWQYDGDLDVAVPRHARVGTYAIRVADVIEAPDGFESNKKLSSQDTWDRGWTTTTLPERLIDGDNYLLEREAHLDQKVITLCPGSRCAGGDVPGVRWSSGDREVKVDYWPSSRAGGHLRFRRAIV